MKKKQISEICVPFTVSDEEFYFIQEMLRIYTISKRFHIEDHGDMKTFWFHIKNKKD